MLISLQKCALSLILKEMPTLSIILFCNSCYLSADWLLRKEEAIVCKSEDVDGDCGVRRVRHSPLYFLLF